LVSPDVSTTYIAYSSDSYGCATTDTVRVNVISHVTMQLPADTTICLTDSFELPLVSDALRFEWSPTDFLSDPSEMNPIVTPTRDIAYTVRGTVGGCFTDATIRVHTVPYPVANAGTDQKICLGSNTTLQATGGSIYKWRPVTFLNNPDISAPEVIAPTGSMRYIVEVKDVLGCPKPVYDTVLIQVVNVQANAGPSDTSIVVGQPLRLSGSGGLNYNWSPSTGLSDPGIRNPLATGLTGDINYILTVTNDIGCSSNDTIHVKVFNLLPDIYVPDAFTPDGDGLNDVIRPIPIGMKSINVFKIYNRWGELLFIEKNSNMGWNGTFHGKQQAAGSYVYYTEGVTYNGKKVKKKGTILLIK
jgi:gliding motility-associated-like protein